jgi:GNAT superfamily N-acetyltransferase
MSITIHYKPLSFNDFPALIALANLVHGDGYLTDEIMQCWYEQSMADNNSATSNLSYVAYDNNKLVGFRITFAPEHWQIDQWCSPEKWQCDTDKVCYFKCNTVDQNYRGYGIGSELLQYSINAAKQVGCVAGVSHLWKQSPGNSAIKYFTKCGGKHIASHPDKWNEDGKNGYDCILCGFDCHCEAAEMIIYF